MADQFGFGKRPVVAWFECTPSSADVPAIQQMYLKAGRRHHSPAIPGEWRTEKLPYMADMIIKKD